MFGHLLILGDRNIHRGVISEICGRLWQVNYLRIWPSLRSTQPCIPPGSLNRVPASARLPGKGGKVTAAGWQVTLSHPIWHLISRRGVVISITNCYIRFIYLLSYLQGLPFHAVQNVYSGFSYCHNACVWRTDRQNFHSKTALYTAISRQRLSLSRPSKFIWIYVIN